MKSEPEHGPIYGVDLLDSLPLDGGVMCQALPSRQDLEQVRKISERTVAGYEVVLEHYRRAVAECERLRGALERYVLSQDGDSHWYVVPVERLEEFEEWASMDPDDERGWIAPEWAHRVGGAPSLVTFTDPKIGEE